MEVPKFVSAIFHGNAANIVLLLPQSANPTHESLFKGKLLSNFEMEITGLFASGYGYYHGRSGTALSVFGKIQE